MRRGFLGAGADQGSESTYAFQCSAVPGSLRVPTASTSGSRSRHPCAYCFEFGLFASGAGRQL